MRTTLQSPAVASCSIVTIRQKIPRARGVLAARRHGEDGVAARATSGRRAASIARVAPLRQRYRLLVAALRTFVLILLLAEPARAHEEEAEPFEEIELFEVAGAVGTLVLPAGAPDRRTPAIVILPGSARPDGRASLYTDQLLGAGLAVLEMAHLPGDSLEAVLTALALHPRVAGQPLGLLGFGAGARLAAEQPGRIAARALLCVSAWKKDPHGGVIGVQTGPLC